MSRRNKLEKFADIARYPNVYENFSYENPVIRDPEGKVIDLSGCWAGRHFGNEQPVTLELACGRGEYCLAMARTDPHRNFIGIDIKGARIWKGATIALEEGLNNVAFLRIRIEQITHFFGPGEIDEIWITFPDPFLKTSKRNRRLSSPRFMALYRRILRDGGAVHLKTDSPVLFDYTLDAWRQEGIAIEDVVGDVYAGPVADPRLEIKTWYERMHLEDGRTIRYVRCRL